MVNTLSIPELREELVHSICAKGITDPRVIGAIRKVPRHLFVNHKLSSDEDAYKDVSLPIGEEQTISQPYTVAYQTELLEVKENDKVLEIGTGSGYQAAVLTELGAHVYTVERQKKLYAATKTRLAELGYTSVRMCYGDGNEGWPAQAPFDKIIVTAASPGIPATLVDQLKVGGVMVIPVNGNIQKMLRVIKVSSTETNIQEYDNFRFVPLLKGTV
jgi:protein-L-isoaspartate(D-aspartate) O-methyltransferase